MPKNRREETLGILASQCIDVGVAQCVGNDLQANFASLGRSNLYHARQEELYESQSWGVCMQRSVLKI